MFKVVSAVELGASIPGSGVPAWAMTYAGKPSQPNPGLPETAVKHSSLIFSSPHSVGILKLALVLKCQFIQHEFQENSAWLLWEAEWGMRVPGKTCSKIRSFKAGYGYRINNLKVKFYFFFF